METYENNNTDINTDIILSKISDFVGCEYSNLVGQDLNDKIKEICVKRLCEVVGIKCGCNFRNPYFNFFGCVMGQAICNKLSIKQTVAPAGLRLIKYDGINFISKAEHFLLNPDIEEAFIDIFDLTDDHKDIIKLINWEQL